MSREGVKKMSCDFTIRTSLPIATFCSYTSAQAKVIGVRGYIVHVSDDLYRGVLQAEEKVIEAFRQLLIKAGEFISAIKELHIAKMKEIREYAYQNFEVLEKSKK